MPLTLAVSGAICMAIAAHNAASAGRGQFGQADHVIRFENLDADALGADVAAARGWFPVIDLVGHHRVSVPGRAHPVDYRSISTDGHFAASLVDLRDGRFPTDADEVAVTDRIAAEFGADLGAALDLDGTARTVVGVVENPGTLSDEFVLVAPDAGLPPDDVTALVGGDIDHARAFRPPSGSLRLDSRGSVDEAAIAAATVLGITVVGLVFIGLLAAAHFVVIAQRRRRQLGILAAVGATERQLRLALVANGVAVGLIAAVVGSVVGVAGWIALEPRLEVALDHRLDRWRLPWWVVAAAMVLAIVTAAAAAWWPARVASRASIVHAIAARPTRPRPVHRSATLAVVLIGAGLACFAAAGDLADETSVSGVDLALSAIGILATIAGVLLLCPLAVRFVAGRAAPLPVAARLALRDLGRYQARSGPALAAIAMALGIPVAIIVSATAARAGADAGNLPGDLLLVRAPFDGPFIPEPDELADLADRVGRIATAVDATATTELAVAVDPQLADATTPDGRIAITLVTRADDGWRDLSLLYVATPELLDDYGPDADTAGATSDMLTSERGDLGLLGVARTDQAPERRVDPLPATAPLSTSYTSLPSTLVTPEGVERRGWDTTGSGRWLLRVDRPPTAEQLAEARDIAGEAEMIIEQRDSQAGLATLRTGAMVVGVLLALGVLAMTIGLLRSEATPDLRVLTASGASTGTRRAVTAVTAATLAALGVVIGAGGAITVLVVGYLGATGLDALFTTQLAALLLSTPTVAAVAGWLLAGREPPAIGRTALP